MSFTSCCLFNKAIFIGDIGGSSIKFINVTFSSISVFSEAVFDSSNKETTVKFTKVKFLSFTDFGNTEFRNRTVFDKVLFEDKVDFLDTLFKASASSARYYGASIEFNKIKLLKNSILSFKSSNPNKKIFNNEVKINFEKMF